jgi:polyisoprenoid-binding protein YceI
MTSPQSLRSRPIFWIGIVVLVGALIGGTFGLWYLFFRPSGPAPVNIGNVPIPSASFAAAASAPASSSAADPSTSAGASSSSSASGSPAASGASAASGSSAASASSGTSAGLDGTWTVNTSLGSFSDFTGSFVGYRVQEQLASIGANTAVGRTPDVEGSMTIEGNSVTAAEFKADLTTLKSDDDRRDGQLRRQGIQTSQFPTATFKLAQPIDFASVPADGQTVDLTATGDFTLHGVTKSVEIPLQAKRSDDVIVVTGSLPVAFADYDITKPNSFVVLTIDDHGTMEFQLLFTKA